VKNIRRFEASTKTLLRLLDEQVRLIDVGGEELEQNRLSILEVVDVIKISMFGDQDHEEALKLFQ